MRKMTKYCLLKTLAYLLLLINWQISTANTVGIIGRTFPIIEMDFLQMIQQRWQQWKHKNLINNINLDTVKQKILQPKAVALLVTDTKKSFYYNPSIFDSRTGTYLNPLNQVQLHSVLLFLNADDPKQICWAKKIKTKLPIKIILTGGNIKVATEIFHQAVYFDQNGWITKKLMIKHIPAIVKAVDNQLFIQEQLPC